MLRQTTVKNGRVEGIPAADPRITAYKGIPFAAPPVGDLRWRPPQPAKDWDGVLRCDRFAPISVQEVPGLGDPNALYTKEWHVDSTITMSEDCLYLNVWTPAKSADEKLPVMFWIFGGGLQVGYPSEMEFDGERIARRGVVLVSVNYRVNVFGFFSHPEITVENSDAPANFGLLDQRAGMQWVQENISAFGGDPDNITIFGQSAGAGSTMAHLTSPLSKGLFHKAIPQSGGGISQGFSHGNPALPEAEEYGKGFFNFLGVENLEQARKIDAQTLFKKAGEYPEPENRRFKWSMVIDNMFLPCHPKQAIMEGKMHPVPILSGNTVDEFPVIPLESGPVKAVSIKISKPTKEEDFVDFAKERFGTDADKYMKLCGYGETNIETVVKNGTFNSFELGNWLWYRKSAELGVEPMYLYSFNPPMPGDNAGSFHSSDLWFTFETLAKCWRPFKGRHYDLARIMCNYWTNFAKYGDPNGDDVDGLPMPRWEPYSTEQPFLMSLDLDPAMDRTPPSELMRFLIDYEYKNL